VDTQTERVHSHSDFSQKLKDSKGKKIQKQKNKETRTKKKDEHRSQV